MYADRDRFAYPTIDGPSREVTPSGDVERRENLAVDAKDCEDFRLGLNRGLGRPKMLGTQTTH